MALFSLPRGRAVILPAVILLLVMTGAPGGANAQDAKVVAESLFREGRSAMLRRDYATACARFRESQRVDPQVGTELNLARCEEQRGRIATAWARYRAALDTLAPAGDDRAAVARERIAALEPRLPRLVLVAAPGAPADLVVAWAASDAEVLVASAQRVGIPVDPGVTVLVARAARHAPNNIEIRVAEGERRRVVVAPGPRMQPSPNADPTPSGAPPVPFGAAPSTRPPEQTPPPSSGVLTTAGIVLSAVGGLSVVAGAVTGGVGLARRDDGAAACDPEARVCSAEGAAANDDARALLTTTTATWVAGLALLGAGITLLVVDGDANEDESAAREGAEFAVQWAPGGAVLAARWLF
ncbi:MAG: hypothetical protein AAGN82_17365 [Myxococcota bacterium]